MQSVLKYVIPTLGVGAGIALMIVSACMNWLFGYHWGRTEFEGQLYGAGSVAADVLKALIPFFIVWAWQARNWLHLFIAFLLINGCMGYSVTSSLGFAAANRTAIVASNSIHATLNTDLKTELPQLREEVTDLTEKLRWKLSARQRRTFQRERDEKQARLDAIHEKLGDAIASGTAYRVEDPQAAYLAGVTGYSKEAVANILIGLVAFLIEVGSTGGLFLSFSHLKGKRGGDPQPPIKRRPSPGARTEWLFEHSGKVRSLDRVRAQAFNAQAESWLKTRTRLTRSKQEATPAGDLFKTFVAETNAAMTRDRFCKACNKYFRAYGFEKIHTEAGRVYPLALLSATGADSLSAAA